MKARNIDDLRRTAGRRLPQTIYDYIEGGAYRELTLGRNRTDFDALRFRGTTMNDVSRLQTATLLFGELGADPSGISGAGLAHDLPTVSAKGCAGHHATRSSPTLPRLGSVGARSGCADHSIPSAPLPDRCWR